LAVSLHPILIVVMGTCTLLHSTGDERRSRGNLVVAVVRGCTDALTFGLGIFFVIDAQNLWIRRDVRPGRESLKWF